MPRRRRPVVTDSREAGPGSLYVARVGERLDGHDFIADAADHGAVAALTSRRDRSDLPGVVVPDVQAAFVALARHLVDACADLTVIGVTGSSGKTSTKDLLAPCSRAPGRRWPPSARSTPRSGCP